MTTYSKTSVYYTTPIDDNGIMGIWNPRDIPVAANDIIVTISAAYNQRPDLMAYDMYGSADLWWVFTQRNPGILASDPLGNFLQGTNIFVPDSNTLKSYLGI